MERDGRTAEAIEMIKPLREAVQCQRPTPDSIDADMLLDRLRAASQSEAQAH